MRINHNLDSLKAQRYLTGNQEGVSKSLEKLSSGVRINSAADGPASLVISENMRAQIAGVDQAIDNNQTAVSLVQTAEGALTEVNRLLTTVRQRSIHAANEGINDPAMLEADQLEIENALQAVDRIAQTTQFGDNKLLNGSRAINGSATGGGLSFVAAEASTVDSGQKGYDVVVNQNATQSSQRGELALTQDLVAAGETLTIRENGRVATYTTSSHDTVKSAVDSLNSVASRSGVNVSIVAGEDGVLTASHNEFGSDHSFQLNSSTKGVLSNSQGQEITVQNGLDIKGTINGESSVGKGQVLMGRDSSQNIRGLVVKYEGSATVPIAPEGTSVGSVRVNQNALTFQVGANKGQTVSMNLLDVSTSQIARGVKNDSNFNSLADIDVRNGQGAQDAIGLVDKAIQEISSNRGALGAFQKNTLESNLSSLRVASENLVAAESTIRDTDMAKELAEFTKNQILMQSSTAQLAQANSVPQNVMRLLS